METITIKNIQKTFTMGDIEVNALRGVSLTIGQGEFVAIMGASGSGKSTLMNILGCLDIPSSGEYYLEGGRVSDLDKWQLADIRNKKIGFVFQGYNLLARTSALENVSLPLLYDRCRRIKDPSRRAVEALEEVGLGERVDHEPNQLSGGQQQRVAIARALVNKPAIILADEPTGNLDSRTTLEILSVFQRLNNQGMTIVLVTHEPEVALFTKRVIEMRDGLVLRDEPVNRRNNAVSDLKAGRPDNLSLPASVFASAIGTKI